MHKSPFRAALFRVALAALLFSVPAEGLAAGGIDIGSADGLVLAGYDKNDDLKWTIAADVAELEKGSAAKNADALKNGKWNVKGLKVNTFTKGESDIVIESPRAVFFPKQRRAESKTEIVTVKDKADRFSVSGKGWSWECDKKNDLNTISVTNCVNVILKDAGTQGAGKKITVKSDSLVITLKDDETVFAFGNNVKVTQENIVTTCDRLEIVIPQNAHEMDEAAHDRDNSQNAGLDRIKKITGIGSVVLTESYKTKTEATRERKISGDFMELNPTENTFSISGKKITFKDDGARIEVCGNKADGILEEADKKLHLKRMDVFGTGNEPVSGKTPSTKKEKSGNAADAEFKGERLSVISGRDDIMTVRLDGNVKFSDKYADNMEVTCETLEADCLRDATSPESADSQEKIREIRATGKAEISRDTKSGKEVCKCESAQIDVPRETTILRGSPDVTLSREGFEIKGNYCEIDKKNEFVRFNLNDRDNHFGNAGSAGKVSVEISNKDATYTLTGDSLAVFRDGSSAQNTIFDMVGNVRLNRPRPLPAISVNCDRLLCHYAGDMKKTDRLKNRENLQKALEEIKKIEALGNVKIDYDEIEISGGKALIFNDIEVVEWMREDDDGSDGKHPKKIRVLPEDNGKNRPKIIIPETKIKMKNNRPASETANLTVEGDDLEVILGERRVRCWLRENVSFTMTDGTEGTCKKFEAELRKRDLRKKRFETEAVFCRDDVKISGKFALREGKDSTEAVAGTTASPAESSSERKDSAVTATGELLEIFPPKQIGYLSGNAQITSSLLGVTTPGTAAHNRFILDLAKKEVRTEMDPKLRENTPAQVARPRTMLPKGILDEFSKSLKKNDSDKKKN